MGLLESAWEYPANWAFYIENNGFCASPDLVTDYRTGGMRMNRMASKYLKSLLLQVYQPMTKYSFAECSYLLNFHAGMGFSSNMKDWVPYPKNTHEVHYGPRLAFSQNPLKEVPASGQTELTLEVRTPEGEFFPEEFEIVAEATAGYIPMRKIASDKGIARFNFRPMGLKRGDEVEISFRFATATPILSHKITIT